MPIMQIATNLYPANAAATIYVRWVNGNSTQITRGSGIFVSTNDVLTAAHMVWEGPTGGTPVQVNVAPGQQGYSTPYGIYTAATWNYFPIQYVQAGYVTADQAATDFAVIGLGQNAGAGIGIVPIKADLSATQTREIVHYPSAYAVSFANVRAMWSYGTVGVVNNDYLNIEVMKISPGSSGGGIIGSVNNTRYVTGVVSTGSWGAYITSARYATISSWMTNNNSYLKQGATEQIVQGLLAKKFYTGNLVSTGNRVDRYSFYITSRLDVQVYLYGTKTDADFLLYDLYGDLIAASAKPSTIGDITLTTLNPGTYYIDVTQYAAGANSYILYLDAFAPTNKTSSTAMVTAGSKPLGGILAA